MFNRILLRLSLLFMLFLLTACGGGDGGNSNNVSSNNVSSSPAPTTVSYSKAILKVSLYGTLPTGSAISGLSFTLFLLQPDLSPSLTNGAVDAGVVTPSGTFANGIQTEPVFTPSNTATKFGNMLIALADTSQAGVTQIGEVATITLQLANHAAPPAGSYLLAPYGVTDLDGNAIPTLKAFISNVVLQ